MHNPPLENLWIDTDLAIGYERPEKTGPADVDDGFALAQLLNTIPQKIKGISAVFGNTTLANAHLLTREFLHFYPGLEIPIFKGASQAVNLAEPEPSEAVRALAGALKNQKLTLLAIGPLTNIATLLLLHPAAAENIREIVIVAGRRKVSDHFYVGSNALPFPDFNFELDPVAYQIIAHTSIPITLCPFEVSSKVMLMEADLDRLARGNALSQFLARESRPWLGNWQQSGSPGFHPFDALASHYLLYPDDIRAEALLARIEYHPDDTVEEGGYKPYLICDKAWGRNVKYCYHPRDLNKSTSHDYS
mgnify:CR=1 FL=1